jgi:predicted branched-subunit amino acid permease
MEKPAPASEATLPEGIKDSLPIAISYLPVAFAFGLNATGLGFTPLELVAPASSTPAPASLSSPRCRRRQLLWVAALTVMAMDVRHVLYGPSLRSRLHRALDKRKPRSGPLA